MPQPVLENLLDTLHSLDPENSKRHSQENWVSGIEFHTAAVAKQTVKWSTRMTGFQFCLRFCLETPDRISGSATPVKTLKQGKQSLVGSSIASPCFHTRCCSRLGCSLTDSPPPPHLSKMVHAHQRSSFPSSSPVLPVSAPALGYLCASRHHWTLAVFKVKSIHMKLYFDLCFRDTASVHQLNKWHLQSQTARKAHCFYRERAWAYRPW